MITDAQVEAACLAYVKSLGEGPKWPSGYTPSKASAIRKHMKAALEAAASIFSPERR